MADVCSGFESQNYLKDRCRKCFRQKDKHDNSAPVTQNKKERRKSWREKSEKNQDNGAPEEEDGTDLVSISSYMSATSKGISSVKSCESMNDTRSMVTAVSGSVGEDERVMTPTEDDHSLLLSLKDENRKLTEANKRLKEERERCLRKCKEEPIEGSEQSLVAMLEERLNEAESSIQDYRDENTVLKCELRELQETTYANSDAKLKEKITATEALCDELMEENESLKNEVRDLQQEIEEMQDQYREEEIEEFRELQRELEQNAKNCRVLQFKLRKAERMKEQTEAEKTQLQTRLNDLLENSGDTAAVSTHSDSVRVKELESELRIAKEVSVRLHNELEQTEAKRYKLEDELFYMKEKVRELQTQNKWREARNKTDVAMKRLSAELAATAPTMPEGEISKELRDALEREIDSREQLRFAEEDLKRTQQRLKEIENENEILLRKLSKTVKMRPPMVRSASEGNAHLQLELAEHEVEHLSTKVERLERTNDHLTKKIIELETDSKKAAENGARPELGDFNLTKEMEKDMGKMIAYISDLKQRNHELNLHLKNYESKEAATAQPVKDTGAADLRSEREKRRAIETELTELKQIMVKSDNQKIIALATKIEQLNNQQAMINERCNVLHKKAVANSDTEAYANELKGRVEALEKELSDLKGAATISNLQGNSAGPDEIEQCCEVLASIETQTSRLCKQVEKIDQAQKDERRRSLSKDSSATIIAELANLLSELKNVHTIMDTIKPGSSFLSRKSPSRETAPTPTECARCAENQKVIDEQQNEVIFYKKKNKDLTNQILQTEDRWTIEIEKQRQIFENEIKGLSVRLADSKRQLEEQSQLLQSKSLTLIEKTRAMEEQEDRCNRLQHDLEEQKREKQELELNQKSVREFEIKYKKLESIFDQEREKMNGERSRAKTEFTALKKIADDTEEMLKTTTQELRRKETTWKTDKANLEREIATLKKQLQACRNGEGSEHEDKSSVHDSDTDDPPSSLARHDSDKITVIDLKKELALYEKKYSDSENKVEDLKIANADLLDQLNKAKQGWQKDKEAHQHKLRQTEKIRMVEMDALQQKFSSRMRIMEDTNKSLHSQLVLARRERDSHKETLANVERTIMEERKAKDTRDTEMQRAQEKIKDMQKSLADVQAELERANTDLRLTKEARKADQILWKIDRARGRNEQLSEEDIHAVEQLQTKFSDCEKFYVKETERLTEKLKNMTQEFKKQRNAHERIVTELREHIRVLEIEQRNLSLKKDNQMAASEILEAGAARLQQAVHLNELQRLTRKYRLSSIIDQLQFVTDPIRRNGRTEVDNNPDGIRYIINQLIALRDEDAQAVIPGDDRCSSTQPMEKNAYTPSVSECDATYDNISQSSLSIRSVSSMPVRTALSNDSRNYGQYGRHMSRRPYPDHTIGERDEDSIRTDIDERKLSAPQVIPRTSSFDQGPESGTHSHSHRAGTTSILCRVRREELARGGQPSVKLMARAFEAIDTCPPEKQGFFSMRKSRSVETTQGREPVKVEPPSLKHSMSNVEVEEASQYATLPRGGRNPFKNMGSKLVERVRRSLSRSSRHSETPDSTDPKVDKSSTKAEKNSSSLKKTKKRSAEAKARKTNGA